MRKSVLLYAGLLAAAATAASADHQGAVSPPGSAGDCWKPAFLAGDADAVAACYVDDAVMIFPGGPLVRGRAAIREEVTTWGTFTITMVVKADGTQIVERGSYTDVSRQVDGRWLYVVDHASDDPAPPVAPVPPVPPVPPGGSH